MTETADGAARRIGGSFRDPGGFVFEADGRLFRQINRSMADEFDAFVSSGLHEELVAKSLMVPHRDHAAAGALSPAPERLHRIIEPERIPFISYPYEWCFSQLKDAALATLDIQRLALERGLTLRDSSAFNIQFLHGRAVLIDSLSFERYREGEPWVAYRQFCQHFLAPLALMATRDARLIALTRSFIDGIPLDLASRLLPLRTRLSPSLNMHIHLHARAQRTFAGSTRVRRRNVSRLALRGLIDNLASTVRGLHWRPAGTEWGEYYEDTNYTDAAMQAKARLVDACIERVGPTTVWDLGANTGVFSRLASARGIHTVAFDVDEAAVEKNYLRARTNQETTLLALVMDLTNPSPALGWDHDERFSLVRRGPADLVLALALVHHLAISNNVPLERVARFLGRTGRHLVIEFVPKSDSQVRRLLATREDVFPDYDRAGFEAAFGSHFDILETQAVPDSERTLYLMRAKRAAT